MTVSAVCFRKVDCILLKQDVKKEEVLKDLKNFSNLSKYATVLKPPSRQIIGRDAEIRSLLASLARAEVSNPILLGEPGSGKTALVQGASIVDKDHRIYLEVNIAKMAASEHGEDGAVQMASRLKALFDEAQAFRKSVSSYELVLFIDEFHQIVNLSTAATEAIKPMLADSATRGVKVIAATTYGEFNQYISSNQALVERLQRINVREPNKDTVITILKNMAKKYDVSEAIINRSLYDDIYDFTNRYIPANSQPRKSILVLDAMIGWHKAYHTKMNKALLANVIYESSGINVAFNVNGREIERALNSRVYGQKHAVQMVERRLQIAVADLHDKSRPMTSFLFTGPTGVGKTEMAKGLANLIFGSEKALIRYDMSEYNTAESVDKFRTDLTMRVWAKPYSIILIDEIEKAHSDASRLLLQVLDDARLSDKNNREVSFANSYIVGTTNVGSEIYKQISNYNDDVDGSSGMYDYVKVIRAALINDETFPSELVNRFDSMIAFNDLKPETLNRIIRNKVGQLIREVYDKHNVTLTVTETIIDYLLYENIDKDTDAGGARGVIRRLNLELTSMVARYINIHPDEKKIAAKIEGKMASKSKTQLKSKAKIVVGSIQK